VTAIRQLRIVGIFMALGLASRGQDRQATDYASKPVSKWIEALKDEHDATLRWHARKALGPDGPYATAAVSAIIEALGQNELPVSSDAASTLADYGSAHVPDLVRALKRPEAPIRAAVTEALGLIRPKPFEIIPDLIAAMKDPAPEVRSAAAKSLGAIRRPLAKTIPALAFALSDTNDEVREAAAAALCEMGRTSKPALPALIAALKDKDPLVRGSAAQALWKMGPGAKAAVPALIEALQRKPDGSSRWEITQALGGIGPEAERAVPVLIEAMQAKDDDMLRQGAIAAIGRIGPGAKAAVPALIAAAKHQDNPDRDHAIAALGKIGPEAKAAVPILMDALSKRESYLDFRRNVAEALGGIGPPAREAVPALAVIARSQWDRDGVAYGPTRQAASEAIMKIDPEYGAKHGIALAYLDVRLGKTPSIKLGAAAPLTEDKKKHIKQLIADLALMAHPDFGLSSSISGHAFAPLPDHEHVAMVLLANPRVESSSAMRRLVEIGPDALPFLLGSLGDKTPTKLKVPPAMNNLFGNELDGNPLNSSERRVLSKRPANTDDDDSDDDSAAWYQVKVGDACFVAIGQIVGRAYSAVRYQPSAIVIINSPVRSASLRDSVRAIWSSRNPAQKVLGSLLIDYATEGIFNGKSLDGWGEGSNRQIEAAVRLLYYFPKESAPLIAERLKRMDVSRPRDPNDSWMLRDVANGLRTIDFLREISWCREPVIRKALFEIFQRTNDVSVTLAVSPSVKQTRGDLIIPRLQNMLRNLPDAEDGIRGDGYELLLALGRYTGKAAKTDFEEYVRGASLQRLWTMCWVLDEVQPEWALEFLFPMLSDKRTGFGGEGIRLCDIAAMVLSKKYPDLKFDILRTRDELDRQIEQLRKQITKKRRNKG
jgi:HEAT repeat protein